MARRLWLVAVCALFALSAATAAQIIDSAVPGDPIAIDTGRIAGSILPSGVHTYFGVPYAAPPVRDLRWKAPQPLTPWKGVYYAVQRPPACYQRAASPMANGYGGPEAMSEDCLYLNVYTGAPNALAKQPVMVWIHGGAWTSGAGAIYQGEDLAKKGVVYVSVNYRLGVFGFLADPALGEDSGDYGLEDQQAALRWVQRNATAFGGNPHNVTLAGESAGSVSTCSHLAMPSSRGLFQRAIMNSGPCAENGEWPYRDGNWYPRPRAVAYQQGAALAKDLGCTDPADVAGCLRTASVATLLDKSFGGQGYGPAYGAGSPLPTGPGQAIASGRYSKVPVMHGTTRDEHRLFVAAIEAMSGHVTTAQDYQSDLTAVFGADAGRVLAEYPLGDFSSPSLALATVWTDRAWSCPALRTAAGFATRVPTYAFEFADRDAPWASDVTKPGFPTGAFHAAELQYLFEDPQFPGPVTKAQRQLSDRMISYWRSFARTGDPNGAGVPPWSRFQPATGAVQSLAPATVGPVDLGAEHRCDFWSTIDD